MRTPHGPVRRFVALVAITSSLFLAEAVAAPLAAEAAKYAGIVMDAKTGKVLYSHESKAQRYPASLTKMMTLYMLFEAMEAGKVSKSTRIRFSQHAASMQPTKLGVPAGKSISAEQAILALVTKSANDAAAAVAEHLGGTESEFAALMTKRARQIGMKSTTFRNASGLPDSRQVTNAYDMAILGVALREHFPQYYHYFSTRSFTFGKRKMGNHNRLLGSVKGVDGIKTGYTRASGFNLVSSVERNDRSIVAVVLGGRSGKSRNAQMVKLIDGYLSKASRGEDKMLVARAGNSLRVASLKLPDRGPLPNFRRASDPLTSRVQLAHTTSGSREDVIKASGVQPFDIAAIESKLLEIGTAKLPVPRPAPYVAEARLGPRRVVQSEPTIRPQQAVRADPIRTATIRPAEPLTHELGYAAEPAPKQAPKPANVTAGPPKGWQIQIAAVPSQNRAVEMLEHARGQAPDALGGASIYTETVKSGGQTLYRARFAGFVSKSAAWDACSTLKSKKFDCIALAN